MDHAMSDTARRFISQVLLVFLAMLLIISGIWGSPTSLAYRHLFLDSMMIVCLMRKPFSQSQETGQWGGFLSGSPGAVDCRICAL